MNNTIPSKLKRDSSRHNTDHIHKNLCMFVHVSILVSLFVCFYVSVWMQVSVLMCVYVCLYLSVLKS